MSVIINVTAASQATNNATSLDNGKVLDNVGNGGTTSNTNTRMSTTSILVAKMVASQMTNYMTSNVGKWTGNSHNQVMINNAQELVGLGIMAYANPMLAIASVGVKITTTVLNNRYEQKLERKESQQRLARLGYNNSREMVGMKHGN